MLSKRKLDNWCPVSPGKQGYKQCSSRPSISAYERESVNSHTESINASELQYLGKESKKKYRKSSINITRIFQNHQEKVKHDPQAETKLSMYRCIFNTEYNFSFHLPKRDQ